MMVLVVVRWLSELKPGSKINTGQDDETDADQALNHDSQRITGQDIQIM